jgi:ribosomal protein S30
MAGIVKGSWLIILFEGNSTGKCKVCKYRPKSQTKRSSDKPRERNRLFWSVKITDVGFMSKPHHFIYFLG